MILLDAVRSTHTNKVKQGEIVLVGDKIAIACGDEMDRCFCDVTSGSIIQLPAVGRVLVVIEPLISIDPASAIAYDAEAPDGTLLVTGGGPAIYTRPREPSNQSVYVFMSGEFGKYRRSGEPAFTRWQIGVERSGSISTLVAVDVSDVAP